MATALIKLLVETCAHCGGPLATDNTGSGKPWLHLDGEPADGHYPAFGVLCPDPVAAMTRVDTSEEDDAAEERKVMPPPEIMGRPATEDEIGNNRTARRQIVKAATNAGFTVDVRFSRGPVADQYGRFNRMADSVGILGVTEGRAFHAWWLEDSKEGLKFQNARCHGVVGFQTVAALKKYIAGSPDTR